MNFKVFGKFLIAIGLVALVASGYFYHSVNNQEFKKAEYDALIKRTYGTPSGFQEGSALAYKAEKAGNKGLIFGAIGGVFLLLGIGLCVSAKEDNDQPSA